MLSKYMTILKQGDNSALEQIYEITKNLVFSICFSIVSNYQTAEDLTQDTYAQILKNISNYKDTNAKAWIATIAKNLSLNYVKSNKRIAYVEDEYLNSFESDTVLRIHDESGIIRLSRKVLKDENFQIVILHTIGGMKLKEIAQLLDIPQGTVRWKYKDSLTRIRRAYEQQEN